MTSHESHGVSLDCLFNSFFKVASKHTSKPVLLALWDVNPSVIDGFPSQMASNAVTLLQIDDTVSNATTFWWQHEKKHFSIFHGKKFTGTFLWFQIIRIRRFAFDGAFLYRINDNKHLSKIGHITRIFIDVISGQMSFWMLFNTDLILFSDIKIVVGK